MTTVRSLHHVGVIVEDLDAATEFFVDLGLEKTGATTVEGAWVGGVIGLEDVRSDIVFVSTPDGRSNLELCRFQNPVDGQGPQPAPANRLGLRHLAFLVEDLQGVLDTVRAKGFDTVGTIEEYEDVYRLCYVRGPEGIIIELAEELGGKTES